MLKIDAELRDLIHPLEKDEFDRLEENIKKEGCRDAIILWNGTIVDGHNRHSICSKNNIPFKTINKKFKDRNEVILWMIDNQLGRRNISKYDRTRLALKKEDLLKPIAKENQSKGGGSGTSGRQKSDKPIDTKKEVAKIAKVSHDTVSKVKYIEKKADEAQKKALSEQKFSINKIYTELKKQERKKEIQNNLKKVSMELSNGKRRKMKVLNLYAGIGGNRKLWSNVEVTAVESNEEIAKIYSKNFPKDKVFVGDAEEYLLEHFKEFDFIWASPPCPTHSKMQLLSQVQEGKKLKLPDMKLYGIIIFLKTFFKGNWVVENVMGYYEPLIKQNKVGKHYFWSNEEIPFIEDTSRGIIREKKEFVSENVSFDLSDQNLNQTMERKILNNCVKPEIGLYVFETVNKTPPVKQSKSTQENTLKNTH